MKNVLKKTLLIVSVGAVLHLFQAPDASASSFSVAQQNTPAEFPMGSAASVTYRVCNNSSGNGNKTIRNVRFYLANNTYTTLTPLVYTAPNWTCAMNGTMHIYCSTTAAYYIPAGTACSQYIDFKFNIYSAALTQDHTDQLSNVTARFSGSNTYRNYNSLSPNLWTWKSFLMTLVPSSYNIGQNCPFSLTMTVKNNTTSNITAPNYVTSQPKPPLRTSLSGGATAATASVPADFTLNSGLTSSMTWTYIAGASAGTLNFS